MLALEVLEEAPATAKREPLTWAEEREGDEGESHVTVHRAVDTIREDCGVRYQRCGGGWRVIRRSRGGRGGY